MNTTVKAESVGVKIKASTERIWKEWYSEQHLDFWNKSTSDWYSKVISCDFNPGGAFSIQMESTDGTTSFKFEGTYLKIETNKHLSYKLNDGRIVYIDLVEEDGGVTMTQTFEPNDSQTLSQQISGWRAILKNFKAYLEQ